jgi:hypothetical protein
MSERSVIAFEHAREAAQRFEYFILGVSVALCGYIGQTLKPQKLGLNPQTLEIGSLGLIIASVIIGFVRLDQGVRILKMNQTLLDLAEKRRKLVDALDGKPLRDAATGARFTPEDVSNMIPGYTTQIIAQERKMEAAKAIQITRFRWRNCLLGAGFLALMAAKVLAAYFS